MIKSLALLLQIVLFCAKLSFGQYPDLELPFETYRLPNGLRILLQPDPSQSETSVEFWIHAGARDEAKTEFGFAHFFEHATPYGLASDPEASARFRSVRTDSNAQTRKDYTRYYVKVKPEGLGDALKYSADRLRADTTAILSSTIENHRKNVLAEFDRQEASPFWGPVASQARESGTFGVGHPYGHSTYGTKTGIESFTKEEITRWYKNYFYPSNTILFVVGKFDTDLAKKLIKKEFGNLIDGSKSGAALTKSAVNHLGSKATISIPSKSNFIGMTWQIPAYQSKDIANLELLAEIADARLKSAPTRPVSVIAAGARDLFEVFELAGEFGMYASFEAATEKEDIESFIEQAHKNLISSPIYEAEITAARSRIIERIRNQQKELGFIGSRTELLGEGLLFTNQPDNFLTRLKLQAKADTSSLRQTAAKYLKSEPFTLIALSK